MPRGVKKTAPVLKNGVTKDKDIFKLYMQSGNKNTGTNANCHFQLGLPYSVNQGYCFIESLTITATDDTLFPISLDEVHVKSTTVRTTQCYRPDSTGGKYFNSLCVIPCNDESVRKSAMSGTTVSPLYLRYRCLNSSEELGFPVSKVDLNTQTFNIKFTNQDDVLLDATKILRWNMTLVFVQQNNLK